MQAFIDYFYKLDYYYKLDIVRVKLFLELESLFVQ